MEMDVLMFCRFCAEVKPPEKLIRLESDTEKLNQITEKLLFLHAVYVNVSCCDSLPKTICLVCYDSLNKAYDFLVNVKRAQEILLQLIDKRNEPILDEPILEDVEKSTSLDDYSAVFVSQSIDSNDVPCKSSNNLKIKDEVPENLDEKDFIVPKIENEDCLQDVLSDTEDKAEDFNVQDILDAALNTSDPTISIYATELKDFSNLTINTWCDFPWRCLHCGVQFESINMLRLHSKQVHKKCYAFVCDCKTYTIRDDFNMFMKHIVRKHFNNLANQCYHCGELLEDIKLRDHVKYDCERSENACAACGEILENKAALEEHTSKYTGVKKQRKPRRKRGDPITPEDLTCKICNKVYKNLNSIRDHMKLHRNQRNRDHTCDRCGKTFYSKGSLKSHITLSHDKVAPHVCKICNKSFLFANMLRRHVDMHYGVKPFACEQCGKRFRLNYQLNCHKIIHTDEMPFGCRFCSKRFRFKQIMVNHERQHTGVKPYSCELCGMEFTNWSNYNKHMKRRHNMDQSKKKYTPEGVFNRDPETGQLIKFQDESTEEWKSAIMKPGKRGKKKVVNEDGT